MRGLYAIPFTAVGVSAQQDFFEYVCPATKAVELHSIYVGNSSDAGDAQAEMLGWAIKSGQTSTGSGGSTVTPAVTATGDAASGGTAKTNNTTKASGGTIATRHADTFNVQGGLQYRPTPEERLQFDAGERFTVELTTTPADALTMSGVLYFRAIP